MICTLASGITGTYVVEAPSLWWFVTAAAGCLLTLEGVEVTSPVQTSPWLSRPAVGWGILGKLGSKGRIWVNRKGRADAKEDRGGRRRRSLTEAEQCFLKREGNSCTYSWAWRERPGAAGLWGSLRCADLRRGPATSDAPCTPDWGCRQTRHCSIRCWSLFSGTEGACSSKMATASKHIL